MSTLDKIRADALVARKAKEPAASVLVTLVGEIDTKTKSFSPARPITEAEVIATVQKFLKGINETIQLVEARGGKSLNAAMAERTALEVYLPKQMSEDEIHAFVANEVANGSNMGQIMAALKAEHAGKYDGKLASQITKQLLAAA